MEPSSGDTLTNLILLNYAFYTAWLGGWTILKWILERHDGMVWTGSIWLRIGTSEGLL
jgi:hypothetical protein